jgi:hypothetical protein
MEERRDSKRALEGKPGGRRREGSLVKDGLIMLKMI